jgi:hypothetical protein
VSAPPLHCPCCEAEFTGLFGIEWGNRVNTVEPLMPFVCSACASFLIFDVPRWSLSIPTPEELAVIQNNRPLWQAVTDAQKRIRALPDRAPVRLRPGG